MGSRGRLSHRVDHDRFDGLVPTTNTLIARLRSALAGAPNGQANAHELVRQALEYAADTEQYIAELNARIQLLESAVVTDDLTGLLNRRGFDTALRRNLASAARHEETGVLAILDLNGFKAVNDSLGHAAGDEVLRAVGRFLKRNVRATDYAARIGGDEFAILFVRADHARARERARILNRKLGKLTVEWNGKKLPIKASLGLASYDGGTEASELIQRADRAMYSEKNRPVGKVVPMR